eukprot:g54643.t1
MVPWCSAHRPWESSCWDPCLDKAEFLAAQVVEQVRANGLDGVDVDYEDILDTDERKNFLKNLTLALRRNSNALATQNLMETGQI